MEIRAATVADMPAIVDVFNASIRTTATWSDEEQTLEDRRRWFDDRTAAGHGVVVAETDGEVVGFAAYGDFRDTTRWPGYLGTVENTVHVAESHHGDGVGRALMEWLIDHARTAGKHVMIAAVDGENAGSVAFHESLGFEVVGRLPEVGRKFDRWLDLVFLHLKL